MTNLEFSQFDTATLTAMRDAAQNTPAMAALVPMMDAEIKAQKDAAEKAEKSQAARDLADQTAALLSNVVKFPVKDIAEGISRKSIARALVAQTAYAYDVSELRARHAVDALLSSKTDVKTVADGVAYAIEHGKSTVYGS